MMGVFVQMNEGSRQASRHPIGYVIQENGCWDWVGAKRSTGYGCVFDRVLRKMRQAHHVLFEAHRGPLPVGLQLDHLCRNTICVNPWHLEPVTNRENVLRGVGRTAKNARKEVCHRGHPLTLAKHLQAGHPHRICLTCRRERDRKYRADGRKLHVRGPYKYVRKTPKPPRGQP